MIKTQVTDDLEDPYETRRSPKPIEDPIQRLINYWEKVRMEDEKKKQEQALREKKMVKFHRFKYTVQYLSTFTLFGSQVCSIIIFYFMYIRKDN